MEHADSDRPVKRGTYRIHESGAPKLEPKSNKTIALYDFVV